MPYQSTIEALISRDSDMPPAYRVLIHQLDTSPTPEAALLRAQDTIEALESQFSVRIRQIRVTETLED